MSGAAVKASPLSGRLAGAKATHRGFRQVPRYAWTGGRRGRDHGPTKSPGSVAYRTGEMVGGFKFARSGEPRAVKQAYAKDIDGAIHPGKSSCMRSRPPRNMKLQRPGDGGRL